MKTYYKIETISGYAPYQVWYSECDDTEVFDNTKYRVTPI